MVVPTIIPGNSVSGYEVENSLRFNLGDTGVLRKTFSGSPTETQKCTISFWTKLADSIGVTASKSIFSAIKTGSKEDILQFHGINNGIHGGFELAFQNGEKGAMYIGTGGNTLARFRDAAAWYHFVIAIDSTQSTASNRVKVYVNGVQKEVEARIDGGSITDDVVLEQNYALGFLTASAHSIGENVESAGTTPYDGYLADFNFIDGTQLDASYFGETDNNGVWIPIKYAGSYGNYGFFMEFKQTGTDADASGMGADTSGNTNHFDPVNLTATDVTTDTPTNTFCTWNPLDKHTGQTLSEGNTKNVAANSAGTVFSTIGVSEGKWYFEYKVKVVNAQSVWAVPQNLYNRTSDLFSENYTTGLYASNPSIYRNGSNVLSNLNGTISANDIIMWAMDLDNNNIYFGKNGSWADDSGFDQSDFANADAYALTRDDANSFIVIGTQNGASASSYTLEMNWGNPPYANSSGVTDGKYGNFEFAPPSGYYALCSKRIAEFG